MGDVFDSVRFTRWVMCLIEGEQCRTEIHDKLLLSFRIATHKKYTATEIQQNQREENQ
jgi:hypothetical protein